MKLRLVLNIMLSALMNLSPRRIPVGGQAVIEGVLMKGPEQWGLAVREPGGSIWQKSWKGSQWLQLVFWKLPVVRGFASMAEMLRVGMRALSLSAEISLGEEDKITPMETAFSIIAALAAVAGLFIALPMFVSDFIATRLHLSYFGKNITEGVMRGVIFIGYVVAIGLWKDMRRVFAYHGAEHKTINAYENSAELKPEKIAGYSRIHRRCGTSFMLVVIIVSVVIFSVIGGGSLFWRIGSRIILLPLVIGVSYEFIRGASNSETWGRVCITPALSLQYLTTREPSSDQIEVALAALLAALDSEDVTGGRKTAADEETI